MRNKLNIKTVLKLMTVCIITLGFAATAALVSSCGTSAKRNLSTEVERHTTESVEACMTFYVDNHTASRREADRVFNQWAETKHLKGNITGKRLLSINPKEDRILLTYDFRLTAANQERVTLVVRDFVVTNKKRHKQTNAAYVNGRKYDFRH